MLLTKENEVWNMGYGGKLKGGLLRRMFSQKGGPLGHGDDNDRFVPTPIQNLKVSQEIKQIATGITHSMALTTEDQLYVWGKGEFGVNGNGSNKNVPTPKINRFFNEILEYEKVKIKKIQAVKKHSCVLLEDGRVYTWGLNDEGQLAIGSSTGINMYETQIYPILIEHALEGKKVKDFELGSDISVFLTDDNQVYVAGSKTWSDPYKLKTPAECTITGIFAGDKAAGYINDQREAYFIGTSWFSSKYTQEISDLGLWKIKDEVWNGKLIEKIGGSYRNHYCILIDPERYRK